MTLTQTHRDCPAQERHAALIRQNIKWIRQAIILLNVLDDTAYSCSAPGVTPHRAGAHLRHVIEFYDCFLDGLYSLHIDYDARRRDESIVRSCEVAIAKLESICERLETTPALQCDSLVWVRVEDADALGLQDPYVTSSVGRELLTLSSHTIHHFALIAVTLGAMGIDVPADFGVAPATMRHQRKLRGAA